MGSWKSGFIGGVMVVLGAVIEARTILKDAYGFHDANIGDANGENGW